MADTAPIEKIEIASGIKDVDAFGRFRVSNPKVLFESVFTFDTQDELWTATLATGGTITRDANARVVDLNVTTTSGSRTYRRSRRNLPYQAGRSQLYSIAFLFDTNKANLRQRIGAFDSNDGIFLERTENEIAFVVRTSVTGSPSDANRAAQSVWNVDKLDGTGPSKITLDLTKIQMLMIDYGAGSIRCGFFIEGRIVYCHAFTVANTIALPFMARSGLTTAAEIENTGTTASTSKIRTVLFCVMSETGQDNLGIVKSVSNGITARAISTALFPVLSFRLKSTALNHSIQLITMDIFSATADTLRYAIVKNGVLTGASFASVGAESITEVDVAATVLTGGTILHQGYHKSSAEGPAPKTLENLFNSLLTTIGSLEDGTSEIFTLAAQSFAGAADVAFAATVREFP